MLYRLTMFIACLLVFVGTAIAAEDAPLLATWPTMSRTEIVYFCTADTCGVCRAMAVKHAN